MNAPTETTLLQIYDTIQDPNLWPKVLDTIVNQIGAVGAMVFEWEKGPEGRQLRTQCYSSYFQPELVEGYIMRCGKDETRDQDVFEAYSMRHDDIDLIDDDVLAPSVTELRKRKNVQALERFGIRHRAAGLLNKDNTTRARFSVQLGVDRGPLTPSERAYLRQVLPHVAKALDLGRPINRLAQTYQGILAAMNQLQVGLCILDGRGLVAATNAEFERQMQDYAVFRQDRTGRLRMQSPEDAQRLDRLCSEIRNHGQFGARPRKEAIRASDDTYLCVEVTPLHQLAEAGSTPLAGFMLLSTDTSRPLQCDTEAIQMAFGLTHAEADLIEAITRGLTNAQIAEERDRAVPTINSQVKSILAKTDCATRTQLVRLMMSFGTELRVE